MKIRYIKMACRLLYGYYHATRRAKNGFIVSMWNSIKLTGFALNDHRLKLIDYKKSR